ncbi:MAG: sugar phosphate isomerase/epimerase [Verrucomicrobiales bacterium]|nr:sugar phosphate isomerase/epimerase [Verrucomicrobiales bacterium]
MKLERRRFLTLAAGTTAALPLLTSGFGSTAVAATPTNPSFLKGKSRMRLGTVTYNLAKDWDVETLIKNCESAGFEGAELRTTHAHKVEVALSKAEREEVRKRFADSKVELMGLGSAFDYHTADAERLKKDIQATKDYLVLAHDVGASGVKVRPNGFPKDVPKEKTLDQIGRSLQELGEFGAGYGVAIRLEVHGEGTSLLPHIRRILDVADHKNVGITWNSNQADLAGEGFDHNFNLVKDKIFCVHMRDLFLEEYPFRQLLTRLNETGFSGYCLAEIPDSKDPVRVMRYYRALWLSYQGLL